MDSDFGRTTTPVIRGRQIDRSGCLLMSLLSMRTGSAILMAMKTTGLTESHVLEKNSALETVWRNNGIFCFCR